MLLLFNNVNDAALYNEKELLGRRSMRKHMTLSTGGRFFKLFIKRES